MIVSVTRGAHHISLTVSNLDVTRKFFLDTLGYEEISEVSDYPASFLSGGKIMIKLRQAADPVNAIPFDRKNTHHLPPNPP